MLIVAPGKIQDLNATDSFFVCTHLNDVGGALPFVSVFRHIRDFDNRLTVQHFVLGTRLHGHEFYTWDRGTIWLIAPRGMDSPVATMERLQGSVL